jgi:excinuclease ABC subunit C
VTTEVEALQLEYAWIKEYDPRFNVRYRDDKSYPFLAVTLDEEFPRLLVMRGRQAQGRALLRAVLARLGHPRDARPAAAGVSRRARARPGCSSGTARSAGHACSATSAKCSAPCVGRVTVRGAPPDRRGLLRLHGRPHRPDGAHLEKAMRAASDELEFERAARLRDDLAALRRAMEKQAVVFGDGTDADVVAFAEDELEAAVQVFHVRAGGCAASAAGWWRRPRTVHRRPGAPLLHAGLRARPRRTPTCPAEVLVPELPADAEALADVAQRLRGAKVTLRVPQRGDKKALMETVARNAGEALTQHKLRRAGDLSARSQALEEIADGARAATAPLRIECYDVSQIQGTDVVASMVVFEDGLARKSEYRRFIITGATDDVSAISEVLRRGSRGTCRPGTPAN